MSRLLYDRNDTHRGLTVTTPQPVVSTEVLFGQLDNHMAALDSVQTVYSDIATESLTFVDTKNVALFNEYMKLLQRNFGISPKTVSPVALESMSQIGVNYELSLEGWMKEMWVKVKAFFSKIYESIKEFMAKHFTRLGRLKNKLTNIQTVAKEATNDLKTARLDDLPSGLASKFKGTDDISESVVLKGCDTANQMALEIKAIADITASTAKDGLVSAGFVSDIKKLKDVALKATEQISANKEQKSGLGIIKDRKERSEINKENKTLTQVAKDAQNEANSNDSTLASVSDGGASEEGLEKEGAEAFKKYMDVVVKSLEKYKGIAVIGGKTISKVAVTESNELEVEFEEEGEAAKGATLTNKEGIIALTTKALEMIENTEKQVDTFTKTNDLIMKQVQTVDGLILDIDRVAPEKYGTYRKVLDKRIRTRLNMVKTLFRSYNQVSRSFFDASLTTGDAVVDYCVVSLKHFK